MANNLSAKKRIKITKRNRLQNKYYRTSVRTLIRSFFKTLDSNMTSSSEKEKLQKMLSLINSLLDKGKKRNVFHKNMVSRKKAKLASYLKHV